MNAKSSNTLSSIVVIILFLLVSKASSADAASTFVTTPGTGPDKWASVWLLRRHVSSRPVSVVLDVANADIQQGVAGDTTRVIRFDAPDALYDRTAITTTYSALQKAFAVTDIVAQRMGTLVHEIEIDAWRAEPSLESRVLEQAFRGMQVEFGREAVTQDCYLHLFDAVALALANGRLAETLPSILIPQSDCLNKVANAGQQNAADSDVETLSLDTLLRYVDDGAHVVFVDTRERKEFDEGHIPGAINLTLRQIDRQTAKRFDGADLVIAYCVKDFRGFEAARALRSLGVSAAIMRPHGMRGWVDAGLPIVGGAHLDEATGMANLQRLARQASGRSTPVVSNGASMDFGQSASQ